MRRMADQALFCGTEQEKETTVRRYLPIVAVALLIVVAGVLGTGPYWP